MAGGAGAAAGAQDAGRAGPTAPAVEVRRSRRRRRTVTAYREGDLTVVCIPARFSRAEEQAWVERMLARLAEQDRRRRPGDADLARRAQELSARYLDGRATPTSVRWAANQRTRWGSTTPADGTIRLSTRLRGMPGWVLDYVLLHELAHLIESGHGPEFWALLDRYPRTERARGYLDGVSAARDLGIVEPGPDVEHEHGVEAQVDGDQPAGA
jgi:predicted metal-dependent hydrolase